MIPSPPRGTGRKRRRLLVRPARDRLRGRRPAARGRGDARPVRAARVVLRSARYDTRFSASPDTAEPAAPDAAHPDEAPRADGPEDTAHAHARKLEQIKDLYLTAEAIGEANVDKHFDQLLAQQRELISEYFKQSNAARPRRGGRSRADADPGDPGDPGPIGGPAGAPESARVAADQPRIW